MQTSARYLVVWIAVAIPALGYGEQPSPVADLPDPASDHFVDLALVGQTLNDRNAELLADVTLQLAAGERVLGRTHKSGITARSLLQKAIRVALDARDEATLERLTKAAEAGGDQEWVAQIDNLKRLHGGSRDVDPARQITLDSVQPEVFALLQSVHRDLRTAELLRDATLLDNVEQRLASEQIPADQREGLGRLIKQARENLPKEQTPADASLQRLAASSRGWFEEATGIRTPVFIQDPTRPMRPRPDEGGYTDMWKIESGQPSQPPSVDGNGNIWSGSSVRGRRGQIVGRARLTYNAMGHAYWDATYRNQFGSVSSVRALGYDKNWGNAGRTNPGQSLTPEQARAILEWDELSRQGRTRPTLRSDFNKRPN